MKVDTTLGAIERAAEDAKNAEAAGYDGAFSGETNNDPFLPLALAAQATERIEIGTAIAVAFARSPMALAYTAWDLQRLSRGRFSLGLGSQVKAHIERRYDMDWGKPATQMRDFVAAMRAIWHAWENDGALKFHSEHYDHTLMSPNFTPRPHEFGTPDVLIAGVGESMTRVAGEVADGFLAHAFSTQRWMRERTLPALEEGRARAGLTLEDFSVKAALFVATGDDEQIEKDVAAIRGYLGFYASTPAYLPILELHGWGELGPELTALSKAGRWSELPTLISDEMLHAFAVIATPDELPAAVLSRCDGMVDRVSFISSAPSEYLAAAANVVRNG